MQVTYYQELDVDHDWATYVYPLATNTRRDINVRHERQVLAHVRCQIRDSHRRFDQPESDQKDFAIARHGESYQQASLETRSGDLSRDVRQK